ncbi:MFS transporter [Actinosynnema sp. ALI-1.44]|uniref:MFS transporter n=1 Tax=Actinosynnema sp. ALI-1.44 TaxID=1933779 RepID=UPI00143CD534|nr:MFS transporter [Actinosynnema sp. ALI-1.44]
MPKAFWILFAGQLANRIGNVVVAFLVFYLAARGLDAGQTALVMAVFGGTGLISQPVGGALSDRFGARVTLVAGMLGSATCLCLFGVVTNWVWLTVTAGLLGLVGEIYRPASAALLTDIVPPAQRMRAFGLVYWAVNLGFPIAGAAGGLLASHGYGLLFVLDAGTCLVFAGIIAVGVRHDTRGSQRRIEGYGLAVRDRTVLVLVVVNAGFVAVLTQCTVGVAFAVRDAGLGVGMYGLVAIVNGLGIVVLQPLCARLLCWFEPLHVLAASGLVVGAGMAMTGLARTPTDYLGIVLLWTLGEAGAGGIVSALVADRAPAGAQGRYQALLGWGTGVGKFVATAAGAFLYSVHPGVLWIGCAVAGLLCCLACFALAKRLVSPRKELHHAVEPVGQDRRAGQPAVPGHDDARSRR